LGDEDAFRPEHVPPAHGSVAVAAASGVAQLAKYLLSKASNGAAHVQDVATGLDSSFDRMARALEQLCKAADAQTEILEDIRDNQELILRAFDASSDLEVKSLAQFFTVWGKLADDDGDEEEEPEVIQVEAERI